jgi:hypothetical protein
MTGPAYSQQTLEDRYQRATDFFNNAKMEDACEIFQQIAKEKPDYKQTQTFMKVACSQVDRMVKMENDLWKECDQLFNQGRLDDAKVKCEQADKILLKNLPHRSQVRRILADIDTQQGEDRRFGECKRLMDGKKYEQARSCFGAIVQAHGRKSDEANTDLARIDELIRAQQAAQKTQTEAKNRPPESTGTGASTGAGAASQGQTSGESPAAQLEQPLRLGLNAYFTGHLEDAQGYFSDYLNKQGAKPWLALFFRGAAHAGLYFLSGEKETNEKDMALADFRSAKEIRAGFLPPENYVSPKILALYSQAVHSASQ